MSLARDLASTKWPGASGGAQGRTDFTNLVCRQMEAVEDRHRVVKQSACRPAALRQLALPGAEVVTYDRRSLPHGKASSHRRPVNSTSIAIGTTATVRTIAGPTAGEHRGLVTWKLVVPVRKQPLLS